jgi:PHP family Zn ribbon phosphoesterase
MGVNSKAVEKAYFSLLEKVGNEFRILMDSSVEEIERASSSRIAEAISRMRQGKVHIEPGYDGEYGKINLFDRTETESPRIRHCSFSTCSGSTLKD